MKVETKRLAALLGGLLAGLLLSAQPAVAEYGLNMPPGATPISKEVYGLHMLIMWICVIIGILVFGAIIYSVIKFRRSKGAVASQFHHSTTVEIVWTVIPMVILIVMAIPATRTVVAMEDTSAPDLTIKVTGYQWKWGYEYLDEDISFYSSLEHRSNLARQPNPTITPAMLAREPSPADPSQPYQYLLEVDEPLVVPVGKKIRFLLTANDVIHSWWVPAFGWKKDAIPGFINEAWARIEEPGVYRGQCAELCGRDHAFMPIVVIAKNEAEYRQWVEEKKTSGAAAAPMEGGQAGAPVIPQAPPAHTTEAAGDSGEQTAAGQQTGAEPSGTEQQAAAEQESSAGQESAQPSEQAAAAGELSKEQLMQRGEQVYNLNCVACHQAGGAGLPPTFPSLHGSPVVTGPAEEHIKLVLFGRRMMTPFGHLSDEDIAAVITFERNSWGNDTGVVQPADVKAAR